MPLLKIQPMPLTTQWFGKAPDGRQDPPIVRRSRLVRARIALGRVPPTPAVGPRVSSNSPRATRSQCGANDSLPEVACLIFRLRRLQMRGGGGY